MTGPRMEDKMNNETMNEIKAYLVAYLQNMMDDFKEEAEKFGQPAENRIADRKLRDMIAVKELAEHMIGEPVNLQLDGQVTIGF